MVLPSVKRGMRIRQGNPEYSLFPGQTEGRQFVGFLLDMHLQLGRLRSAVAVGQPITRRPLVLLRRFLVVALLYPGDRDRVAAGGRAVVRRVGGGRKAAVRADARDRPGRVR